MILNKQVERADYLLISVHEVHETFMVIVMVSTFGGIDRQLQIVWSKTVSLTISVGEDPGLE